MAVAAPVRPLQAPVASSAPMMPAGSPQALYAALRQAQQPRGYAQGGMVLPQPTMPSPNWSLQGNLQFQPPMQQGLPANALSNFQSPSVTPLNNAYAAMSQSPASLTPSDLAQLMQYAVQGSQNIAPVGSAMTGR